MTVVQFTKDELLLIKSLLETHNYGTMYGAMPKYYTTILDKVCHMIVACEIGCSKEIVYNWDGSKK